MPLDGSPKDEQINESINKRYSSANVFSYVELSRYTGEIPEKSRKVQKGTIIRVEKPAYYCWP